MSMFLSQAVAHSHGTEIMTGLYEKNVLMQERKETDVGKMSKAIGWPCSSKRLF